MHSYAQLSTSTNHKFQRNIIQASLRRMPLSACTLRTSDIEGQNGKGHSLTSNVCGRASYLYKICDRHNSSALTCTKIAIYITKRGFFLYLRLKNARFSQFLRTYEAFGKTKVMPIANLVHPAEEKLCLSQILYTQQKKSYAYRRFCTPGTLRSV